MDAIIKALIGAQEDVKETTAELMVAEYKLKLLRNMVKEQMLENVEHSYNHSISWKEIARIMGWNDLLDDFETLILGTEEKA